MKIYKWIFRKVRRRSSVVGRKLFVKSSKVEYQKHKEHARAMVHRKIASFNAFYNFTFHKVAIRNQRSRWGSCSKKGNLNFNYRLVLIPEALADYVIVHELCHLGEFNHSKNFWNLVAQTIPNHAQLRKQLHKIRFGHMTYQEVV